MRRTTRWLATAAVLGLAVGAAGRAEANLVVNPGFETGSYSGWTLSGDTRFDFITSDPSNVHSGTYAAQFAGLGADAIVSQDIATTVGDQYAVSFWLKSDGYGPSDFTASFGGQVGFTATALPVTPYIQYSGIVTATSLTSALEFSARNDAEFYYLDDVSVMDLGPATAAPEPSTLLGGSLGVALALGYARRRRRARAATTVRTGAALKTSAGRRPARRATPMP